MLNLIPKVKELDIKNGFLKKNAVFYENINCDERVVLALSKLPFEKMVQNLKLHLSVVAAKDMKSPLTKLP